MPGQGVGAVGKAVTGANVGLQLGATVGEVVTGVNVGTIVTGVKVGLKVGANVGIIVTGANVGTIVTGADVGLQLGLIGIAVGELLIGAQHNAPGFVDGHVFKGYGTFKGFAGFTHTKAQ